MKQALKKMKALHFEPSQAKKSYIRTLYEHDLKILAAFEKSQRYLQFCLSILLTKSLNYKHDHKCLDTQLLSILFDSLGFS